jgi:hypothetical protein
MTVFGRKPIRRISLRLCTSAEGCELYAGWAGEIQNEAEQNDSQEIGEDVLSGL